MYIFIFLLKRSEILKRKMKWVWCDIWVCLSDVMIDKYKKILLYGVKIGENKYCLVDFNFVLNDFLKFFIFIDYIFKYIKIEYRFDK